MSAWKPGDRVEVRLPDRDGLKGRKRSRAWFPATVSVVDPEGRTTGVVVDLDYPVNGCTDAFATHAELRPAATP